MHAQIRCHPETKSKVRPKKKYARFGPMHGCQLRIRCGPCSGIVEPFKHFLRVTAHPQILALELRAPMGACSGQYGSAMRMT